MTTYSDYVASQYHKYRVTQFYRSPAMDKGMYEYFVAFRTRKIEAIEAEYPTIRNDYELWLKRREEEYDRHRMHG